VISKQFSDIIYFPSLLQLLNQSIHWPLSSMVSIMVLLILLILHILWQVHVLFFRHALVLQVSVKFGISFFF